MIEVRGLTKRFGHALAVDNLDFRVDDGEILGFLGPNGAGKTTTMRLLTGFFPPTAGQALIDGHDVVEESLAARRRLGYLPENAPLYGEMRVGEYLDFVGGAKGLDRPAARRERQRVMEAAGLVERAGQLIKQLSKGYRQRVGLAQALVSDPPVLILDEPTMGLDPGQIVEIRSLIKQMAGRKTVVLSSHILSEVAATCQRVLIIDQGRLVAQGPPSLLKPRSASRSLRLMARGPAEGLGALLAGVPGVLGVEPLPTPDNCADCQALSLSVQTPEVAAEVARAVVEAGLGLMELTPQGSSLEDVFVELTKGEGAARSAGAGRA